MIKVAEAAATCNSLNLENAFFPMQQLFLASSESKNFLIVKKKFFLNIYLYLQGN